MRILAGITSGFVGKDTRAAAKRPSHARTSDPKASPAKVSFRLLDEEVNLTVNCALPLLLDGTDNMALF